MSSSYELPDLTATCACGTGQAGKIAAGAHAVSRSQSISIIHPGLQFAPPPHRVVANTA
jgi:hypothetical protein